MWVCCLLLHDLDLDGPLDKVQQRSDSLVRRGQVRVPNPTGFSDLMKVVALSVFLSVAHVLVRGLTE